MYDGETRVAVVSFVGDFGWRWKTTTGAGSVPRVSRALLAARRDYIAHGGLAGMREHPRGME